MAKINLPSFSDIPPQLIKVSIAQSIGLIAFSALKIFPVCNPVLGFALASTIYLVEQAARAIFKKLHFSAFLNYSCSLAVSTLSLHACVHLALPCIASLLKIDLYYIAARISMAVIFVIGDALIQKYKKNTKEPDTI